MLPAVTSSRTSAPIPAIWPRRGIVLAISLVVFAGATVTRTDADLWGHLRFGLDTILTRTLPTVDPYSFTQDTPWINHEWLSEVAMGLAWLAAGSAGLALLKGALAFGVLALVWSSLARVRLGPKLMIVLLVVMGTLHMWATLRPQLWTFACFGILCRLLVTDRPGQRSWVPVLFAVWVNGHGGWVVGLGVLSLWAGVSVVARPQTWRRWCPVLALTGGAILCNPYGWHLVEFVARTVRTSRSIEEWGPLWRAPGLNWIPWIAAVLATAWIVRRPSAERLRPALVLAMLAYASVRVMRIEALFIEAAAILLVPFFELRWPRALTRPPVVGARPLALSAALALLGSAVMSFWVLERSLACVEIHNDAVAPDVEAAGALASAGPGRLVTYFDWGEYAIWHFGPRLRVSMDGRRETVYSDARLAEHDAIIAGRPSGLATLEAWHAEYAWLPSTSVVTRQWLATHGYRIEIETRRSFVAVRADLPALKTPVSGTIGPRFCFPG
jgi:hypothetical protein